MASDVVEETKNQRFHRISEGRVERAVEKIRLLNNLMSSNYESSVEERKAVVDEVQAAVDEVANTFELPLPAAAPIAASEAGEEAVEGQDHEADHEIEVPVPAAPKAAMPKKGDYIKLTEADDLMLIRNGAYIDRAISLIDEGNTKEARDLLHTLMVS